MNRHDTSKSGLFLIELILSIFFFIIAMAVCLQLFVKAHTLSQDTISLNHAILWTQNLAELFLGNNGDFSSVKQTYIASDCTDSFELDSDISLLLLFDKKWNMTIDTSNAYYYVLALSSYDDNFAYEDIYVTSEFPTYSSASGDIASNSIIHHQQIKKYIPQEEH